MNNTYCVYVHTNKSNGKKYVGMTKHSDPTKRWGWNGYKYSSCTFFYNAIKKYGFDNFSHDILFSGLSKIEAYEREKEYIKIYNSTDNKYGYNLSEGGQGSNGVSPSEATRAKLSAANKGRKMPQEQRERLSQALKGRTYSEDTLKKMRQSHIGKTLSVEQKKKISTALGQGERNANFGRKQSDECRLHISQSKTGENHPNFGKHLRSETIEKIRKGNSKHAFQYSLDGSLIAEWENAKIAAKELGIGYKGINNCLRGRNKTSGGYKWEYKNNDSKVK